MVCSFSWSNNRHCSIEIDRQLDNNYGVYFRVENSTNLQTSSISQNVLTPSWDDIFSVTLHDEMSSINIRIYVRNIDTEAEEEFDLFSIPANKVKTELGVSKNYIDSVVTSNGNHFTYLIRHKSDGIIKIKNLKLRIEAKEQEFESIVKPQFEEAKTNLDKILNFKGFDLIQEWGILEDELQDTQTMNIFQK